MNGSSGEGRLGGGLAASLHNFLIPAIFSGWGREGAGDK